MYVSEPFSNFFFPPPLALYLSELVSRAPRAAAQHFGASGYSRTFCICPPPPAAKGRHPPSRAATGAETSLRGKNGVLSGCHSAQALLVLLTVLSLPGPRLDLWSVLQAIQPKMLAESPFFKKLQCLSSKMMSFGSFKLGISENRGFQNQFKQINQSRATCKKLILSFLLLLNKTNWVEDCQISR